MDNQNNNPQSYVPPNTPAPKPKKPFYKKWWFIAICVLVIIGVIGSLGGKKPATPTVEQQSEVSDVTPPPTTEPEKPKFNETEVIQQLEVSEYSYTNSIGTYWHAYVISNNSPHNLSLDMSVTFKDSGGNLVGANSKDVSAFESGEKVALMFMNDNAIPESATYEFSVKEDDYYQPVISNLGIEVTQAPEKVIVSVINNGDVPAQFVEGTALFFNEGVLVSHGTTYFTDDDSEIKPSKTINKEIDCYSDFDNVEVYFTGRA